MYLPKHFEKADENVLIYFIREFPFALIITSKNLELNAEHIPLWVNQHSDNSFVLQGHVAKSNPLWINGPDNESALIVFQGEDAYISPNWLPSKKENGQVVPTWNYRSVHVYGVISYIHDAEWKLALLQNLTHAHEKDQPTSWTIEDAPREFIDKLLPAIVGIEISVTRIQGKFKMSQNQPSENRRGIAKALKDTNATMSNLMDIR